jgi:hypothetical protein
VRNLWHAGISAASRARESSAVKFKPAEVGVMTVLIRPKAEQKRVPVYPQALERWRSDADELAPVQLGEAT